MSKIQIDTFKGILPKLGNDKLPNEQAQVANDVKTASGELKAYRRSSSDISLAGSSYKSLFEYLEGGNNHWVYYDSIVHWVRSPIANDEFERMYTTGSTSQYKAFVNDLISGSFDFTTDFYYPGAPAAVAPAISYTNGGSSYRAYFYTYVSRYSEEGPPSALVETVDGVGAADWDGSSSPVLGPFVEPDSDDGHLKGAAVGGNSASLRIYRTSATGEGTAEFLLVDEIVIDATGPASTAWGSYTYTDTKVDTELGAVCSSIFYDRCPDDLSGLRGHPNGFFAAFKDNVIYFSEPFAPWAWPEDYQIPIDQEIIGIGIFGSTVVVCTDGFLYTFAGPHPTSLYKKKHSFQPCLSQRAIVETDDGVMYPSLEGFQLVSANGVHNVTRDMFKPEDWVDYELETMHGTWYNKAYYGFYKSADHDGHIIIDFLNSAITTGIGYHYAAHVALLDGIFRTVVVSNFEAPTTLYISTWDTNPQSYRNFEWKSKRYILEKPKNFKVAQIIIDTDFYTNVADTIADEGDLVTSNATNWAANTQLEGPFNSALLNAQEVNGDNLNSLTTLFVQDYILFTIIVDGVNKWTKQINNSNMFKLPRGFKNKKWEFKLQGMIPVKRLTVATSTEEIV